MAMSPMGKSKRKMPVLPVKASPKAGAAMAQPFKKGGMVKGKSKGKC